MTMKNVFLGLSLFVSGAVSFGQTITVTNTQTPEDLINNVLVGGGVSVFNITYNGTVGGAQTVQPQVGYFDDNGTTFPISEGIIISTGNVNNADNPATYFASTSYGGAGDPDLNVIAGAGTFDRAIIEFDFIPIGDAVSFNFVFASEEYPNYAPPLGNVNDVFGFFLSGPGIAGPYSSAAENIAILSGGTEISINNINPVTNPSFYVDNGTGTSVPYGGMSVVLTTIMPTTLLCGETYHFKIALADAVDAIFDTAIFLEANSFTSQGADISLEAIDNAGQPIVDGILYEGCSNFEVIMVKPPGYTDSSFVVNLNISGTATNGTDYSNVNSSYTILPGDDTLNISINVLTDGIPEGIETLIMESYYILPCGDTIYVSDTLTIVDVAPSFNVFTNDIVIDCPVPTVDITATTDGGLPSLTYNWGAAGIGQTVDVPGNIEGTVTYNVTVTDACGIVSVGSVDVTLNSAPVPTIVFNENTIVICPDEDATIIATVVNPYSTPVDYSWSPTSGTTNTLTVSPNVATWYYLTVEDGCYTIVDSVKIEMGGIDLTDINVVDATNCPGQPGTPGSIEILPDPADFVYTLIGGGDTYGPQVSNIFSGLDGGIIYFLHVENADGCFIDTAISVGLGANAVTAVWMPGALGDVTCFGDLNGSAQITNIQGGIDPPYTVTWTHTSGLYDTQTPISAGGGDAINNLMGGNWVVTVTDQEGCAWSQLFSIFEPAELTLDFIYNDPSCYLFTDGSVTASTSGGNGGNTFTMTNSAGTTLNVGNSNTINNLGQGWYYTTIVDSEGCTTEDSVFVDQPGELAIDLIINQPLCYGVESGVATVDTVYNYSGSYSNVAYFWNPNPSGLSGIGAYVSNHLGEGTYVLTINDENGCSKVFDFVIEYPDSLYFTEIGYESADCRVFSYQSGNGVIYAAAGGGTPDYDYLWTNNTTGVTSTNTTWGGLNPATYTMVVTDDNGCTLTETVVLDSVSPIADFGIASDEFLSAGVYEGTAVVCVEFTNQSQYFANPNDPNADTTFFWNLNTPDAGWVLSENANQSFDTCYTSAGIYSVCLVALNKNGCSDTNCVDMIIYDPLEFTPVNIFSPDGDGVNDVFTFEFWSQAVATFECTIVNRWGIVVNVMDDITDEWDGTDMSGSPCTDGIYFYTYSGVATNGDTFSGQGTVHIVNSN
jgi:gliding motility-associated-like protein